ncbi:MAG: hypothetical protein IPF72_07000 [Chitinophagaceae bacterium]|nr:hypothetical protein [Chitinophagaceae bacterium]
MRSDFTCNSHLPIKKLFVYLVTVFLFNLNITAQTPPDLVFSPVVTGLSSGVDVVNAGDGTNRLFILRQSGTVRILSGEFYYRVIF